MSPLSDPERRSVTFTLQHPRSAQHLPTKLQRDHRQPSDRTLCTAHRIFNSTLLSSLSSRLHSLSTNKSDLLATALALARAPSHPPLRARDIDAAERLLHYYRALLHSPDSCDGCTVARVIRSNEALFALVAGELLWRRDRSAVVNWLPIWMERIDLVERRCFVDEAGLDAHRVRRLLRTLKARAPLTAPGAVLDCATPPDMRDEADPFADPPARGRRRQQEEDDNRLPAAARAGAVSTSPGPFGDAGGYAYNTSHSSGTSGRGWGGAAGLPGGTTSNIPASQWTQSSGSERPRRSPREGEFF